MNVVFAQPWGALGLIAGAVVVLVHLLRQRPKEVPVTTLFLLQVVAPRDQQGRRVEQISRWWLLLLRLLMVLLATWLLMQPRWPSEARAVRMAIVLDASASMSAFEASVKQGLREAVQAWVGDRAVQLSVLSSSAQRPLLAQGDAGALQVGLQAWNPNLGMHDVSAALGTARRAVGADGVVVFVTDHDAPPRDSVVLLAFARPEANVGLTGVRITEDAQGVQWQATVRNFGAAPQERTFRVGAGEEWGPQTVLQLGPHQNQTVKAYFPEGAQALELQLSPDALRIDDRMWLVRPSPKVIRVFVSDSVAGLPLVVGLLKTTSFVRRVQDAGAADLLIRSDADEGPGEGRSPAQIVLNLDAQYSLRQPSVGVVAEDHPLTQALPWQGLVYRRPPKRRLPEGAKGLLWKAQTPLVFVGPGEQLVVRLDPRGSNADRNPAFVLMLTRYVQQRREALWASEATNVEVQQPLKLAPSAVAAGLHLQTPQGRSEIPRTGAVLAPAEPGLFQVKRGEQTLLRAAANFADLRELNLEGATTVPLAEGTVRAVRLAHSRPDPWSTVWVVLLLAMVLTSFWLVPRVRA